MAGIVERRQLAPGFSIARVITGLWQVADIERKTGPLDAEESAAAMIPYVDAGLTTFDMADHYGSAEQIAGRFRATHGSTRPVELLTKWVPEPGPLTRDDVRDAVTRALDRLRSERIDLLQFHAWAYDDPSWLDALFWLQELRNEGLIGQLGLTNFDTAHLRIALHSGIEVVSNQVCYSLIDRRAGEGMTELCLQHGVAIVAYGAVAGGLLTERWLDSPDRPAERMDTWPRMKYRRFVEAAGGWEVFQELLHAVHGVAVRLGVSMANVAARYVLDQPAVAGIIVGAGLGRGDHIADTLRLFEFTLDDGSRAELDGAASRLRRIPGDCGDEYRRPPFLTAAGDLSHHVRVMPPAYRAVTGQDGRGRAESGTQWEEMAGYCRAVRHGSWIFVSGTTATHRDRLIGGDDPAAQTHFVIDKIEGALRSLGGRLEDVVRTRLYVPRPEDWESVARAHGERFRHSRPANTLVHAALVGDGYRVEMEADAVVA
jgi:aryl-alcohol dehydrogenase-like predicted oxidoreductase/enamine deaminase RidA (YjgF/YER057c/UK114 family)